MKGVLSQNDLIKIGLWDKRQLWQFCYKKTVNLGHKRAVKYFMWLRREMQIALSQYSRHHEFDHIQKNIVVYQELMLKWCKKWYMPWARNEVIKSNPSFATRPDSVKYRTRDMWEKFVRRFSY